MDALIYTVMSSAERALKAQQVHANNLANLDTGGFRADLELATSQAVGGYGYDSRHMSRLQANAVSGGEGVMRQTGRDLDVAIVGDGLFAVEWQGGEAYTRSGNFSVDGEGALTVNGRPVLGDGGPIVLPPYTSLSIGVDGTLSILPPGQNDMQPVDRLRLVRGEAAELTKNEAGLIVARDGAELPADDTVTLRSGHLEGSNVSAIGEMVATMNLNRDFEIQMRLYKAADDMAEAGNRLMRD
ncbi:flagellar hook-basal body complex protein [Azoarcus sp. TTM-91]|uniref:flagellar basal body rod protein FlgF n=1 Tax=Azoarcus sp. TTM-91 TaxID=2691581 RepID=UPI00145E3D7A|nr:flagellar basal body rod protein FlgF [Azoarcus sp. TTM-91]NMG34617.1 flagellar hook-basal body complex protein [Azoarcus sp. TTM-91]